MLGDFQNRLAVRFAEIAATRRSLNYPIYALEHGLDTAELVELKAAASSAIRYQSPAGSHWLVWTALGAEAGYGYSGDEFWPAMESRTGEWRSNEYRQALRQFFRRFGRDFGGPIPEGRWAEHFSIIAWPITNAILPRYLQAHFARHIYDLRFDLAHRANGDGDGLGQLLLAQYDGSSSRFRDFLQQTDLTSRIVLALRDADVSDQVPRIEPCVLKRIVADLEEGREARSYLRDARKVIQSTSVKFSSRLQPSSTTAAEGGAGGLANPQRPRFAARRQGNNSFVLGLRLPNVQLALHLAGANANILNGQRVRFGGTEERFMPASALLTLSRKERPLDTFPAPNCPVFTFENGAASPASVLDSISRIEERPCWVLRREGDGLFREVLGGHVRPGQEYVILSRFEMPDAVKLAAGMVLVSTHTNGAYAYYLQLPTRLIDAQKSALRSAGIGTITGVRIEAAGLNPAPAAVEGLPSWLTTEPIALCLTADFETPAFLVSLDGQPPHNLPSANGQALLQLDDLQPGRHTISVALPAHNAKPELFDFEVVAPRPWAEAVLGKAGFRLVLEPSNASLENLLGEKATLEVVGPVGRTVHWCLETYNAAGHLVGTNVLKSTKVGAPPDAIIGMLKKARVDCSDAIDEAYRVDLVANLEELGRQAQKFPHEVDPLRWKFEARDKVIRLVDETDHDEPVSILGYTLGAPLQGEEIEGEAAISGLTVKSPGSLVVATRGQHLVPIFVSVPTERLDNLADLGFAQSLQLAEPNATAVIELIGGLRLWSVAKPVGHLALLRKASTTRKFLKEIADRACGRDFAELLYSPDPGDLEGAQRKVGGSPGFGLRMRTSDWHPLLRDALKPFCEIAAIYGVETDSDWCRAALTLAYDPLLLRFPTEINERAYLAELLSKRILLRGAFLAKAATQNEVAKAARATA